MRILGARRNPGCAYDEGGQDARLNDRLFPLARKGAVAMLDVPHGERVGIRGEGLKKSKKNRRIRMASNNCHFGAATLC